jgi:hypothetical protein
MMKNLLTVGILAVMSTFASNAYSFSLNVPPEELTENIRLEDLAVTDTAFFYPKDFCIENGSLFLPSVTSVKSRNEYLFSIRIKLLPGNQLEAETVTPSNKSEFGSNDVDSLINVLREPTGRVFIQSPLFCSDTNRVYDEDIEFFTILTIDGKESLSDLIEDIRSKDYDFGND